MTVDFAKEYLLDDCEDCPENENGECMTKSHCFEVKRMAIQALEQTRWIPVSERLPEKGKQVLCCNKSGSVFTSAITYINSNGMVAFGQHYEVIAWMPLPQPYNGESEDEG